MLLVLATAATAQTEYRYHVIDGDTVRYTYTPIQIDSSLLQPQRKGFLHRVVDYFGQSAEDHTTEVVN